MYCNGINIGKMRRAVIPDNRLTTCAALEMKREKNGNNDRPLQSMKLSKVCNNNGAVVKVMGEGEERIGGPAVGRRRVI